MLIVNRTASVVALGFLLQGIVGLGHIGRGFLGLAAVATGHSHIRIGFGSLRVVARLVILLLSVVPISIAQLVVGTLQIRGSIALRISALVRLLDDGVGFRQLIRRLRPFRRATRCSHA